MMAILRKFMAWMRTDGLQHALVCAALCAALKTLLYSLMVFHSWAWWLAPVVSFLAVMLFATVWKELIYDRKQGKGTCEWHDVWCDMIGCIIGVL